MIFTAFAQTPKVVQDSVPLPLSFSLSFASSFVLPHRKAHLQILYPPLGMAAAVAGDGGSAQQSAAPVALPSARAATGRSRKRPARFRDGASPETSPEKSKKGKTERGGNAATRAKSRRGKPPLQKDTALLAAPSADPPAYEVFQVDKVLKVRTDDALLSWKGWGPGENQYVKFIDMAPPVSGRSLSPLSSPPLSFSLRLSPSTSSPSSLFPPYGMVAHPPQFHLRSFPEEQYIAREKDARLPSVSHAILPPSSLLLLLPQVRNNVIFYKMANDHPQAEFYYEAGDIISDAEDDDDSEGGGDVADITLSDTVDGEHRLECNASGMRSRVLRNTGSNCVCVNLADHCCPLTGKRWCRRNASCLPPQMLTPFKRVFVQQFRDAMLSMGLNDSVQGVRGLKFSMYLRSNGEKQCSLSAASIARQSTSHAPSPPPFPFPPLSLST